MQKIAIDGNFGEITTELGTRLIRPHLLFKLGTKVSVSLQ